MSDSLFPLDFSGPFLCFITLNLFADHENYDRLGMASFLLEMVPFASMVFSFTNTVGAALWAADLEKANK